MFPVKCNHDCALIECILDAGQPFNYGLEVGSKAELLMAMSKIGKSPGALLICNGYKDAAFMRLVCWKLPPSEQTRADAPDCQRFHLL